MFHLLLQYYEVISKPASSYTLIYTHTLTILNETYFSDKFRINATSRYSKGRRTIKSDFKSSIPVALTQKSIQLPSTSKNKRVVIITNPIRITQSNGLRLRLHVSLIAISNNILRNNPELID